MFGLTVSPLELIVRSAIVYLVFFLLLRVSGKRELGQFTLFDLALVLLAANALQPAMTGPDSSVTGGLIVIATLFVVTSIIGAAARPGAMGAPVPAVRADDHRA